eukprot:symbB.v1.2.001042.t1/scaffold56.1/size371842/13
MAGQQPPIKLLLSAFEGHPPVLLFDYHPAVAQEKYVDRDRIVCCEGRGRPDIFFSHSGCVHRYNAVLNSFFYGGLGESQDGRAVPTLLWGGTPRPEALREFRSFQKTNHFPASWHLGRKDLLWRNIRTMQQRYPDGRFDLMPQTYLVPGHFKFWMRHGTMGLESDEETSRSAMEEFQRSLESSTRDIGGVLERLQKLNEIFDRRHSGARPTPSCAALKESSHAEVRQATWTDLLSQAAVSGRIFDFLEEKNDFSLMLAELEMEDSFYSKMSELELKSDLPHIEAAEVTETADTSKSLDFAVPAVKVPEVKTLQRQVEWTLSAPQLPALSSPPEVTWTEVPVKQGQGQGSAPEAVKADIPESLTRMPATLPWAEDGPKSHRKASFENSRDAAAG